jgi:hypothetical protein
MTVCKYLNIHVYIYVGMYMHVYMCLLIFWKKLKTFKKIIIITLKNQKNQKKSQQLKKSFLDPQHVISSLNFAR